MRRWLLLCAPACALAGCGADPAPPSPAPSGKAGPPPPVRRLEETHRYARLAVPVAFTADGAGWIGAVDHDLVIYDGDREVKRHAVMVGGRDDALAPLPGGGWIAGSRVLDADGRARWDGWSFAQRYGRFGSPKASSISPDGRVAIVYGADSPSTCLRDRDCGRAGGSAGALVRIDLDRERIEERVLFEHGDAMEYALAASPTAVAALARDTLWIWPARGDAAPVTVTLDGTTMTNLTWATERYLLATRWVDPNRTDVVVLDRDAGWQPVWTWPVGGQLHDLVVRPGGAEVAIAWSNYHATDRVHRDDRRIAVHALDGTRRVELDTQGYPRSIAWSPRGDALLVAMVGNADAENAVVRFAVR